MFCVKCRRVTETENISIVTSKNGRLMRRGQCITCGKLRHNYKQKLAAGGSFFNTLVNNLPFGMHLPGHNFTGPGTKPYKRLNPDETPKECSTPINRLTMQFIITIYAIQNMMTLKLEIRFVIRQCVMS